ncbi:MAG: phosphodiesterase [Pseudomonadota bacterium]
MTQVLQITDTHIVAPGQRANRVVDTGAALTAAVETIAAFQSRIGKIDLVVFTGDLTDHGSQEEFTEFKRLIRPLDLSMIAVPGNHDNRENMRAAFKDMPWMPPHGPINIRVDLEDVTILALDTLVDGAPYGALSQTTLEWLRKMLAETGENSVLLAMHHPPFASGIALMDRQGLQNSEDLASIIADCDSTCRIIAGHLHRNVASLFAGHLTTVCPGTSHAVTLDLGPSPNNTLTMEPGGMQLHCFATENTTHTLSVGIFNGPFDFVP